MTEKIDLRIVKTEAAIKNTFITLLSKKPFEKITVKDIITAAKINRSTFYLHYVDKYDLMDKIEDQIVNDVSEYAELITHETLVPFLFDNAPLPHIKPLLERIQREPDIFIIMARNGRSYSLYSKIASFFSNRILAEADPFHQMNVPENQTLYEYKKEIGVAAFSAVLTKWISDGFNEPIDVMEKMLTQVIKSLLYDQK